MKNTETIENPVVEKDTAVEETLQKRQKSRSIEELKEVLPTSMSRNEAIKYIKYLREESDVQLAKINALTQAAESAFKKAQYYERVTKDIVERFDKQTTHILSNLNNIITSAENSATVTALHIQNIIKGGYNNAD